MFNISRPEESSPKAHTAILLQKSTTPEDSFHFSVLRDSPHFTADMKGH